MFKIYVKPGCPYCAHAIHTVKTRKIEHKVIELKTETRRLEVKKKHNYQTFPQIFFKTTFIEVMMSFKVLLKNVIMNKLFNSLPPKILNTVIEICCSLSTKKCMYDK